MKKSTAAKLNSLKKLKSKLASFEFKDNIKGVVNGFEVQFNHLYLFEFLMKSLDIIRKIDDVESTVTVKKWIIDVTLDYNHAQPTLDNVLALYLQYYLTEVNFALLNKNIAGIDTRTIILQDFNIKDVALRIEINELIGRVLAFTTFGTGDEKFKNMYLEMLSIAYIQIKQLLDQRRVTYLNDETRLGLMCLYYLIVTFLRKNDKEDKKTINEFILHIRDYFREESSEELKIVKELKKDAGTMKNIKNALSKHPLYGLIVINKVPMDTVAKNLFENACLKLYRLLPNE